MSNNSGDGPLGSSFGDTISGAQGGGSFGVLGGSGADTLPTHPSVKAKNQSGGSIKWSIRYQQFDLSSASEVQELEDVLSNISNNPNWVLRKERLANDTEGMTVVTISWAEGTEVKPQKKKKPRLDPEGKPYALQTQYPFPTIEDGENPGTGGDMKPPGTPDDMDSAPAMPPPGASMREDARDIQNAFPSAEDGDDDT